MRIVAIGIAVFLREACRRGDGEHDHRDQRTKHSQHDYTRTGPDNRAAYSNSIAPSISTASPTAPIASDTFAGSASCPLSLPLASAARTAFSISRCEVMPTFLRNLRMLTLNTSSFMIASPKDGNMAATGQLIRSILSFIRGK